MRFAVQIREAVFGETFHQRLICFIVEDSVFEAQPGVRKVSHSSLHRQQIVIAGSFTIAATRLQNGEQ